MNNVIEKLTDLFLEFPGIGPRQAKRFVFALLTKNEDYIKNLSSLILELKTKIKRCPDCFYIFLSSSAENDGALNKKCAICADSNRDRSKLLVAAKEINLENIEKSKCYNGMYFVLGGALSLLDKSQTKKIRMRELFERMKNDGQIKELVLAMDADKEGETTESYIEKIMEPFIKQRGLRITRFARGLSTGAEIEYSDAGTIKHAFLNRR